MVFVPRRPRADSDGEGRRTLRIKSGHRLSELRFAAMQAVLLEYEHTLKYTPTGTYLPVPPIIDFSGASAESCVQRIRDCYENIKHPEINRPSAAHPPEPRNVLLEFERVMILNDVKLEE